MLPYQNRLVNQRNLQNGIADLYYFDNHIFDNFTVPETIDRDQALDAIMQHHGHAPLWHPDPDYMKYYIGAWAKRNAVTWEKLQATTLLDYDPIANYDRTEETDDTRTISGKTGSTTDGTSNTSMDSSGSTENEISADNSSSYQPDTISHDQNQSSSDSSDHVTVSGTSDTTDMYKHRLRAYGNIGVTTTQQMIASERETVRFNIYDIIADSFYQTFCLYVY